MTVSAYRRGPRESPDLRRVPGRVPHAKCVLGMRGFPSALQGAGIRAVSPPASSMKSRLDLLAQQLHRSHHPLVRDQPAGVEFGENAGHAKLVSETREIISHHFRSADNGPPAPHLIPSE